MPTLGIELSDVGFQAAVCATTEPQVLALSDRNGAAEWPGFAFHDGRQFSFGRAAEDMWFVHPRSVTHTFWSKLAHETAEDTARAEASDIAALVQRAVGGDEPWMVSVGGSDGPGRAARYRDVTVLIRSRTRLGVLEHTLRQAGVPYRVEGGTLIYGSREVFELLRVLRAVDDPPTSSRSSPRFAPRSSGSTTAS